MSAAEVLVRDHGNLGEVVLNRSGAHNAISTVLARHLSAALLEVASNRAWRSVVLSSASAAAFCVGADLKERNGMTDADLLSQRLDVRRAFHTLLAVEVPVVAAVHGWALGGGLELALCCDLIVMDETARLGLPEVTVGLVPGGGGTQLLRRRVGYSRAADLLFTGRQVDATEAARLGIADRLVPAGQDRSAALVLAELVAGNSPAAVHNAKRALRDGADLDLSAGLDVEDAAWRAAASSADRREGIAAFNEKRKPIWPDRGA